MRSPVLILTLFPIREKNIGSKYPFFIKHSLTFITESYAMPGIQFHIYECMSGKGKYKFKVINGILSWKNDEMERFMPVSPEILTRVILLYEKQFKNGIRIWKQLEDQEDRGMGINCESPFLVELADWMEELKGIFANTEPYREKEKWIDDHIHLN